ncbi:nitroreductase family protein [uncultured Draconibacterium sp.]|uniref:nitroreductase family protein n=1 Tax=uncultured Draconibacterium sp. TaxID=1573823 RepID=UPI002AA7F3BE|nr:nitroreductase family protein [uncultured Draconibacterium sp.]
MIKELITRNRSYRRFDENVKISTEQILKWIDLARLSASGRNAQSLKYAVVTAEEKCERIFPFLGWAGYLSNWKGPAQGERPVAYIAVINDRNIAENHYCDDGIAMQSILLGVVEDGFGGCMIGSVNKAKVAKILELDEKHELLWVIALGKPIEKVVVEEAENGNIKYWRDDEQVHHVPKRPIDEIVLLTDN